MGSKYTLPANVERLNNECEFLEECARTNANKTYINGSLVGRCIKKKISNKFNLTFALCSLSFARYMSTLTQYCSSARYSTNCQKVGLAAKDIYPF